jgi:hypothetical protein
VHRAVDAVISRLDHYLDGLLLNYLGEYFPFVVDFLWHQASTISVNH